MTTEEKLKHFKAAALEEARQESTAAIEEHRRALEKLFQEHTVDKDRQAALEVKTETDRLKRENNITLSKERLEIKRDISRKQEELKETLFVEVQEKLADYMATQEYQQLLISQIREIMKFAGNEEVKDIFCRRQMRLWIRSRRTVLIRSKGCAGLRLLTSWWRL